MKYLLDTNICSYIIKCRPLEVLSKFKSIDINDCGISSITYGELKYWVENNKRLHLESGYSGTPKISEEIITNFVSHLNIIEFDAHAGDIYAEIRAALRSKGITVGHADLLIGSHAISLNATLVTNNIRDFEHFPKIRLENWINLKEISHEKISP